MPLTPLARRVVTAVVLVPVVVVGILQLPTPYFGLLMALFVLAGAWEWAGLCAYPAAARAIYVAVLALLLLLAAVLLGQAEAARIVLWIAVLFWMGALFWVARYQAGLATPAAESRIARTVAGVLVLMPAWVALYVLHGGGALGPERVLLLMLLVWSADIGAFFTGRRLGRRKLASRVSPGKTVEGVLGGVVLALVVLAAYSAFRSSGAGWSVLFFVVGAVTVLASVLGDLLESLIKRMAGVKDSGVLFPGHGGALDRIDSLTAAAPVFVLGLILMGAAG